jgi:hypothetical protein
VYHKLLTWLLSAPTADASSPQDGIEPPHFFPEEFTLDWEIEELRLLRDEETTTEIESSPSSHPKLDMEELYTLEYRFQSLLKQRLQLEIESHPPLFPWESEISTYEPEYTDERPKLLVPSIQYWLPQVNHLALPVLMPTLVLSQLLQECSTAMRSLQPQGAKMVRAVSTLFPDQSQSLNELAGFVLLAPSRSAQMTLPDLESYESATVQQQMALSLMVAKEILESLTLTLSTTQPTLKRQWQTTLGMMTLEAEYQSVQGDSQENQNAVQITLYLPKGGSISCEMFDKEVSAQRTYPGYLRIELLDVQPGQSYPVTVAFNDPQQTPLTFALAIES